MTARLKSPSSPKATWRAVTTAESVAAEPPGVKTARAAGPKPNERHNQARTSCSRRNNAGAGTGMPV